MNVQDEYFEWLYHIVCGRKRESYRYLLQKLLETNFEYTNPMDGNRAEDGINIRYVFGREYGYADAIIASQLDTRLCSVLEMIVALAIRCEESIMQDSDYGDRTAQWIWVMLTNLGLAHMNDYEYDEDTVTDILERFMYHDYNPNGSGGGLFVLKHPRQDLRGVDIWYQAMWYLTENYE